ncbi:hypothetical protein ACZ91_66900 [Streptomyces regensis]|nr:hypothetical protein ACZ91_66900 [Streptomyces regensis]
MPLSPPEDLGHSAWAVQIRHTSIVAGYPVHFQAVLDTEIPDHPDVIAIVQKFVDVLDSSPEFVVWRAVRTYPRTQLMTPTNPQPLP